MKFFKKPLPFMALAAIAMLVLAACGAAGQTEPSADDSVSNGDSGAQAVRSNLPADIQIIMYQGAGFQSGQELALSEMLAQGKPVVLNFWAGLCPPCRLEMPDLQAVYEEYQDRVLLFGLDVGPFTGLGSREDGRALLQELAITYPAGTTFDAEVVRDYEVLGMPTTYFITPQGEIVRAWTGLLTRDQLVELVDELITASANS